jgi:hypothetical protein
MTKIGLFLATILLSSGAFAMSHQVQSCAFTSQVTGQNGFSVYGCGTYPMTVTVPDAFDVDYAFRALEAKIASLEARVRTLETKKP